MGLRLEEKARQELLNNLMPVELEAFHVAYLEYLFSQECLLRRANDERFILEAVPKFLALVGIRFVAPCDNVYLDLSPLIQLESLSQTAQLILAEPQSMWVEGGRQFWMMAGTAVTWRIYSISTTFRARDWILRTGIEKQVHKFKCFRRSIASILVSTMVSDPHIAPRTSASS
jgi:hypothetical protein